MSSTIKVNNISNLAGDNSGIDLSTNDQIILKTNGTSAVTVNSSQATALGGNLTIPNGGLIGSAGDADAMSIATNGVVTFSQTPVGAGGSGKVLQVKQLVFAKETITTSSASFTSTGKSLAITPSATNSRILIQVSGGSCMAPYVNQFCISTIYRGSTNLSTNGLQTIGNSTAGLSVSGHNIVFLDSPNTTNAVTYTPYYRSQPTKPNVYFSLAGTDGADFSITLTEIAPN